MARERNDGFEGHTARAAQVDRGVDRDAQLLNTQFNYLSLFPIVLVTPTSLYYTINPIMNVSILRYQHFAKFEIETQQLMKMELG